MNNLKYNNDKGFILVAALLTLLILLSIGTLVYTVSTKDIRVSTRIVGEQKAFSAVETGVHQAIQNFAVGASVTNQVVDSSIDSNTTYSYNIGASSSGCTPPPAGFDIEKWSDDIYRATVTGTNTRYGNTMVAVDVGIGLFRSGTCAKTTE